MPRSKKIRTTTLVELECEPQVEYENFPNLSHSHLTHATSGWYSLPHHLKDSNPVISLGDEPNLAEPKINLITETKDFGQFLQVYLEK